MQNNSELAYPILDQSFKSSLIEFHDPDEVMELTGTWGIILTANVKRVNLFARDYWLERNIYKCLQYNLVC